ncbi:MAG: PAS and helix-turn-helix domain-containing protein [Burkholderiales bacterium]|nr:PAS and helix-turn-helix domain-containing protein [Burkholderiales bacterium]
MRQPSPEIASEPNDFELAFQFAGVGLCISRERVIGRCNRAFADMFGYAQDELNGRSLDCLYPSPEEFEHTGSRGFPVMQKSGCYSDERIMRRKNGALFWCHVIGRSLNRDQPFACAVWSFEDISVKRPVRVELTGREREVAQLLIDGKTSKEIARILTISSRTVEAHRARLIQKFNVKSAVELISKLVGLT